MHHDPTRRTQLGRALRLGGIAALAPSTSWITSLAQAAPPADTTSSQAPWPALERQVGGRLGVAVLDVASGRLDGHRLDERFPMCSTFKWLAAAAVLQRVDRGDEQLARRLHYGREAIRPHSPLSAPHAGAGGMTLGQLCEATVTVSDNTAGNLVLGTLGGPAGLTAFARSLGDEATRLDRWENELNQAMPDDPRDTTTPRAMAGLLHQVVLGDVLKADSRTMLRQWLEASPTNARRLKAHLPAGWRLGSKTGTGERGTSNDSGVMWPPVRAPLVVAVYLTGSPAEPVARDAAIASVAAAVRRRIDPMG